MKYFLGCFFISDRASIIAPSVPSSAGVNVTLAPKALVIMAAVVGGLIFGVGMVLAGGCASGTTYRVGEGMMGSFVAALGLTIGALMTKFGALSEVSSFLQSVTITIGTGAPLTIFGEFGILTPIFMIIIGIVLLVLMVVFWSVPGIKKKKASDDCLTLDGTTFADYIRDDSGCAGNNLYVSNNATQATCYTASSLK